MAAEADPARTETLDQDPAGSQPNSFWAPWAASRPTTRTPMSARSTARTTSFPAAFLCYGRWSAIGRYAARCAGVQRRWRRPAAPGRSVHLAFGSAQQVAADEPDHRGGGDHAADLGEGVGDDRHRDHRQDRPRGQRL